MCYNSRICHCEKNIDEVLTGTGIGPKTPCIWRAGELYLGMGFLNAFWNKAEGIASLSLYSPRISKKKTLPSDRDPTTRGMPAAAMFGVMHLSRIKRGGAGREGGHVLTVEKNSNSAEV